jgi:serine phosphatase RsbU (regulator of sigma subunit)
VRKSRFLRRVAFIITIIVAILMLGWIVFIDIKREESLKNEAKQMAEKSLDYALKSAEVVFERNEQQCLTSAQFLLSIQKDAFAIRQKLSALLQNNENITAAFCCILEPDDDSLACFKTYMKKELQEINSRSFDSYFSAIQQTNLHENLSQNKSAFWGAPYFDTFTNNMEMQFFVPVVDSAARFKGFFGINLSLHWLNEVIEKSFKDYAGDDDAFFLIFSSTGVVVSRTGGNFKVNQNIMQDVEKEGDLDFASILLQMRNGDIGERKFSSNFLEMTNEIFFKGLKGKNLAFALSFHDYPMIKSLRIILVITVLIIIIVMTSALLWHWRAHKRKISSIDAINEALAHVGRGETSIPTTMTFIADDDMSEIVHQLNRTKKDLEVHIENIKFSIGHETWILREMESAQQIRSYFYKNDIPRLLGIPGKNLKIDQNFDFLQKNIGGDFYDYFNISPKHACIVCGTVEGKAKTIQSSVNIIMTMTLIRSYVLYKHPLNLCLEYLNNALLEIGKKHFRVKLNIAVVDCETGDVELANIKAPAPFHITEKNILPLPIDNGNPLGLAYNEGYSFVHRVLEESNIMFFHTDGVIRRKDSTNDTFGIERLETALSVSTGRTPRLLIRDISNRIAMFSESQTDQTDDYTILAFQFSKKNNE